jgi:hypothetical protein
MSVNDGMTAAALWLAVASLSVSLSALWLCADDTRSATAHMLAWMREQEQINRLLRMRVEQLENAAGDTRPTVDG